MGDAWGAAADNEEKAAKTKLTNELNAMNLSHTRPTAGIGRGAATRNFESPRTANLGVGRAKSFDIPGHETGDNRPGGENPTTPKSGFGNFGGSFNTTNKGNSGFGNFGSSLSNSSAGQKNNMSSGFGNLQNKSSSPSSFKFNSEAPAKDVFSGMNDLPEFSTLTNGATSRAEPAHDTLASVGNWESSDDEEKPLTSEEISYLNKIIRDQLIKTEANVEIERKDPNSPLFSVRTFEDLPLPPEVLKGVYEMGFTYPSKIQESCLPALLADPPQNMIAQSQSGTGKTAAFTLCMLSRVNPDLNYPQCLCLAPSYELALQIGKVAETMGRYLERVKVAYAVRGSRRAPGDSVREQIVIGTPGTVLDWITKFRYFDPQLITVFVLDEADLMIGMQGHQDQSIRIHKRLSRNCQHLLFSATYCDEVMDFANKIVSDPVVLRIRREEECLNNVKQYFVNCSSKDSKYRALSNIYGSLTIGQAMIFCRTRKEASWLAGQMCKDNHAVGLLSGELDIEQRAAVIQRFKTGREKVLISTNLTARGIDVAQVNIVINYDLPTTTDGQPDFETYLHRIGRTGRFGKVGVAINLVDTDWSREILHQIEEHFGKKILPLDTEDIDALEKIEKTI